MVQFSRKYEIYSFMCIYLQYITTLLQYHTVERF